MTVRLREYGEVDRPTASIVRPDRSWTNGFRNVANTPSDSEAIPTCPFVGAQRDNLGHH